MTIIPESRYVYDVATKINLTLQRALDAIVKSFNRLSEIGARVKDPLTSDVASRTKYFPDFFVQKQLSEFGFNPFHLNRGFPGNIGG